MKTIFLVCFLASSFISSAQTKVDIVQSKAIYYLRTPGALLVDDNGNPLNKTLDTITTIYLEIRGKVPQLEIAWMYGQSFNLVPTIVKANTITAGKKPGSDKEVTFKISKGNSLITLELTEGTQLPKPQKTGKNEILIQGTQNKKKFFYKVKKILQVSSPEFM